MIRSSRVIGTKKKLERKMRERERQTDTHTHRHTHRHTHTYAQTQTLGVRTVMNDNPESERQSQITTN